jgi:hypothetical protein
MAVRVLLVLAAFGVLYGCGQASSPVERQEKQGGVEEVAPEEVTENEQTPTPTPSDSKAPGEGGLSQQEWVEKHGPQGGSASEPTTQASTPTSAASPSPPGEPGPVAQCRILAHAEAENMSESEGKAFSNAIADESVEDFYEKGQDRTIPQILDDMGVPDYGCSAPEE